MVPDVKGVKLIYRGSEDGFKAQKFHDKCDKKGSTLCLVRTDTDKIFGGFTNIDWKAFFPSNNRDGRSFIFHFGGGLIKKYLFNKDNR